MTYDRSLALLAAAAYMAASVGARAAVIDFEDALSPPSSFGTLTSYAGFTWSDGNGGVFADILVVDVPAFGASLQPGFVPGLMSGDFVAAKVAGSSSDGLLATSRIQGAEAFKLDSGHFTAGSGTQTLTFAGYKAGAQVYSASATINSTASTLVTFSGWLDLDELHITTSAPTISWILDDLTVSAAVVPEASTWAMLAVGLGMLGFALRRRIRDA
jgi:hypothetical protein